MTMRLLAALTALSMLALTPARADYVIKDGAAATQTFGSFSVNGVQFPKHVMVDPTTGAAIGVSGAPLAVTLPSGQVVVLGAGTAAIGTVSVSNFPATQAISAANLPLPSGAATAANQSTANGSLASIDGKMPTIGQKTMANSQPVAFASDQSTLNVNVLGGGINAGTAGSPSTDVLTVQGATNGTPLPSALTPNRPATTATDTGATVTTTSSQVLAASATRGYLALINQSGTVDISCRFGTSAAVVGGAGSIDIPARATRTWGTAYLPTAAVQCVSASGSVNLTIQTN